MDNNTKSTARCRFNGNFQGGCRVFKLRILLQSANNIPYPLDKNLAKLVRVNGRKDSIEGNSNRNTAG